MSRLGSVPLQSAPALWRDRWLSQLDRWLSSPSLYRWSLSNPIGRWIMRRRAAALFSVMAGFVHSQVLLACVRLGWFEALLEQPLSLGQLEQLSDLPTESLQSLLDSALSIGLIERRGPRYGLGPLGVPVAAHPGLRAMIEHNALLNADLLDPLALLKRPQAAGMQAYWPYPTGERNEHHRSDTPAVTPAVRPQETLSELRIFSQSQPDTTQAARYSELMARSQSFLIEELLAAYDFSAHRRVLDVGGGQGGWVMALARQEPHLDLELFDLPDVAALARQKVNQAGLSARIACTGGSFRADTLPRGADLVTLLRVAHDHADEAVLQLLRAIHAALPAGGRLLLAEPMAEPEGRPCPSDAYFHFYLLAMGRGRLRTAAELSALITQAGFASVQAIANPMPLHARLLLAVKN